jgi:hypothetical protein
VQVEVLDLDHLIRQEKRRRMSCCEVADSWDPRVLLWARKEGPPFPHLHVQEKPQLLSVLPAQPSAPHFLVALQALLVLGIVLAGSCFAPDPAGLCLWSSSRLTA